jgi:alkanesulfonate monooxygenase SsuD/methylene tetrahydromethanopterin reductase-like flavin-dependent oxidoreductase (luciferase family)
VTAGSLPLWARGAAAPVIEFGVNVNNRLPLIYPERVTARELVSLAQHAETLGFESVWAGDNLFSRSRLEAITTLGAIAAVTRRVRLGTATLIAPLRDTLWLALTWATLDHLSGGRTVLCMSVGGGASDSDAGPTRMEYAAVNRPYARRGQILEEQIEALRQLWSGDSVSFARELHRYEGVRLGLVPVQRPGPPLWIASNPHWYDLPARTVDRMLGRVARLADGWMTIGATPGQLSALAQRIRDLAEAADRDPGGITIAYQLTLTIDDDRRASRAVALEYLNRYNETHFQQLADAPWSAGEPFGTPEDCARTVIALHAAGVRVFVLRFASPDQRTQMTRFMREVRPLVRQALEV